MQEKTVARDERLEDLRKAMSQADSGKGVHAWIVPTEDPHMSEYSPDCYTRREWISKFTGTAGTCIITPTEALLWTDGRYFLQASTELGPEWTLMKAGTPGCPDFEDWLAEKVPQGGKVAIDPFVHTVDSVRRLQRKLEPAGRYLTPLLKEANLVDQCWGPARPPAPLDPIRVHPMKWAGESVKDKVAKMKLKMKEAGADLLLVTMLDEVAWLMNLRGSDVQCNPVFLSYATVPLEGPAKLYLEGAKLTEEVKAHLKESEVEVVPYGRMVPDLEAAVGAGSKVLLDPSKVSYALYQAAVNKAKEKAAGRKRTREEEEADTASNGAHSTSSAKVVIEGSSPVVAAKAIKNDVELAGMKEAHLRDAVALCEFFSFLEDHILVAGGKLTEVQIDQELTARRAKQPGFVGPSFATIAGANANGAIIHYRPQEGTSTLKTVDKDTLLLLDSGGQYECGTTDITRTVHLGTPSERHCMAYTRVLQGHIALDLAVFPEGTPGCALDTLARVPLWKEGLNYRHGTGHGVGAALNVHEGPQSISSRYHITTPLVAKMICSNEPGYYEDGAFGIRIENLVHVKEVETPNRYGGATYFGFGRLTLVPIQTKMMNLSLMSEEEIKWVDDYHKEVWREVSPRLEAGPALEWLKKNTRPLKNE